MVASTSHDCSSCCWMVDTRASILNVGPEIVAAHAIDRRVELVQTQLHPQLGDLVNA